MRRQTTMLLGLLGLLMMADAAKVAAGVTEIYGPPARQAARNPRGERGDGTGQYLELSFTPAGVNGFTRLEVWTSRRENGRFARLKLSERDLQLPPVQRFARELYDFNFANFSPGFAAQAENRVALISAAPSGNSTEFTLRTLTTTSFTLGRPIVLPANPTALAIRPGSNEAWSLHSGSNNLLAVSDLQSERLGTTLPLRLQPQAVAVSLTFSPSGRTAYVVVRNADAQADRGFVQVWDCVTRQIRATVTLGNTQPVAAALSPDGSTLVITGNSFNDLNLPTPSVTYFNTISSTAEIAALGVNGQNLVGVELLAFHPDGNRIFLVSQVSVDVFDLQSRRISRSFTSPRASKPSSIDINPFGDLLLLRDSLGQQSALLDSDSGESLDSQPFANGVGFFLFRP